MTDQATEIPRPVPPELWGKDHRTTMMYVETRCVDHGGKLNGDHMRTDADRHPIHPEQPRMAYTSNDKKYPTRLKDGVMLDDHDDYDCLEDLEAAGLVIVLSLVNGFVAMTPAGWKYVWDKRREKAERSDIAKAAQVAWDADIVEVYPNLRAVS